jgi:hypothetical protein
LAGQSAPALADDSRRAVSLPESGGTNRRVDAPTKAPPPVPLRIACHGFRDRPRTGRLSSRFHSRIASSGRRDCAVSSRFHSRIAYFTPAVTPEWHDQLPDRTVNSRMQSRYQETRPAQPCASAAIAATFSGLRRPDEALKTIRNRTRCRASCSVVEHRIHPLLRRLVHSRIGHF